MISQTQPLVTIGIPTFNRLSGLKNALKCIREQTYTNLEIIVSDNCSPGDEVDRYMDTVTKEDPRVRYFKQGRNIGATANFEFVLDKATGKYFCWHADDDSCEVRFVENIILHMEQDANIVLCSCDVKSIDEHDKFIGIERLESIRPASDWTQTRSLFFRFPISNIFFCIYGIYRTHTLGKCDIKITRGWNGYLTHGEVPFLAQVSSYGKIVSIPEVNKIYRRQPNSHYHAEIRRIKKIDYFMLKLVIRAKLCKLALLDKSNFSTRLTLLNAVMMSLFSSINLRSSIAQFLPMKLKKYIKSMFHL